ncbi:MAG: helix-turn-helix domain-containing protein [bacterium]
MTNKNKRRPTHPGELLREERLPAAGLTQSEFGARLGVSRRVVSEVIHERRSSLNLKSISWVACW